MIRIIIPIMVAVNVNIPYPISAQTSQKSFFLTGEIKGKKDGWVYIKYANHQNTAVYDSSEIQDGKFYFTGKIGGPTFAMISVKTTISEENYTEIWLEPRSLQMSAKITEFDQATINGSLTQQDFTHFKEIRSRVEKKYSKQLDSLKGLKDMARIAGIRDRLAPYFEEMQREELAYFDANPQSYITAYWLRYYVATLTPTVLLSYYDRFGSAVQSSPYGLFIADKIKLLTRGAPGSKASGFITKDVKDNIISLNDLKGSFVLLEFWASWCIPCRKEHPELIELYTHYRQKGVQFIGIADNDETEDAWITAINKDQLPWAQVLRGRQAGLPANKARTDINELFGVQSLPTLILINPEGMIIGRYEENIEDLKNDLKKYVNF